MEITPQEIHDVEQATQMLKEYMPPMLKSLYDGFVEAGFTKDEALSLTQTYMVKTIGKGD